MLLSSTWRFAMLVCACSFGIHHTHAHSEGRYPLRYLSLVESAEILTPSHRVHAWSTFHLDFRLHGKRQHIQLHLEPNHDIIWDDASVDYLDLDGNVARTEHLDRAEHKVYKGHSWLVEREGSLRQVGWARIVVRRDGLYPLFEGAFTIDHDHHHVQLRSNYHQTKHELDPHLEGKVPVDDDEYMVVFRDSDIRPNLDRVEELRRRSDASDVSCAADQLQFNVQLDHPVRAAGLVTKREVGMWGMVPTGSLFGKRQLDITGIPGGGNSAGVNLRSSIGQTAGCPNTRKVALVGVATDCTYTSSFNSTDTVRQHIITQMNSASSVYESTFNITLGLRNLTVSDSVCPGIAPASAPWNKPCSGDVAIQDRLNLFSRWRGTRNDTNSHWTLLTTCNTGSAVGLAWLGQACVSQVKTTSGNGGNESVSGANVVARTSTEWQVIAHETGHVFGAVHDCTGQTCEDGTTVNAQQCCPLSGGTCDAGERYIMNPSTGQGITQFSPCSIGNICSAMGRNSVKSDCLSANKGVTIITGNQCGNGIVETGEDCDCGGEASCGNNKCCDAKTCRFKKNAFCDDTNEDCCKDCQFASSNQICRPSTGECDPEERCTGTNPTCPMDRTTPDGTKCGNSSQDTNCASGHCTSRTLQCRSLMGSITPKNDTYACDSSTCQLSCASPEFGSGVCYSMQQNFLDGTICGGGGKCSNGQCRGSNPGQEITSWINRNKGVVIGIACAIGAFLVFSIGCCLYSFCMRRYRKDRRLRDGRNGNGNHRSGGGGGGTGGHRNRKPPPPIAGGGGGGGGGNSVAMTGPGNGNGNGDGRARWPRQSSTTTPLQQQTGITSREGGVDGNHHRRSTRLSSTSTVDNHHPNRSSSRWNANPLPPPPPTTVRYA